MVYTTLTSALELKSSLAKVPLSCGDQMYARLQNADNVMSGIFADAHDSSNKLSALPGLHHLQHNTNSTEIFTCAFAIYEQTIASFWLVVISSCWIPFSFCHSNYSCTAWCSQSTRTTRTPTIPRNMQCFSHLDPSRGNAINTYESPCLW